MKLNKVTGSMVDSKQCGCFYSNGLDQHSGLRGRTMAVRCPKTIRSAKIRRTRPGISCIVLVPWMECATATRIVHGLFLTSHPPPPSAPFPPWCTRANKAICFNASHIHSMYCDQLHSRQRLMMGIGNAPAQSQSRTFFLSRATMEIMVSVSEIILAASANKIL